MDFIGPINPPSAGGHCYILTFVDHFSRYAYSVRCKDNTAETEARKFVKFCYHLSCPKEILSDRGSHFTAEVMKHVMSILAAVRHSFTLAYNPVPSLMA